jgi:hypothetical protein
MKKIICATSMALALLLGGGGVAQAALVTAYEGAFEYTTGSTTGLDWLDMSHSQGMSYNQVSTLMDSGETFHGWRYATVTEIVSFWNEVTGGNFAAHGQWPQYEGWADQVAGWVGYTYFETFGNYTYAKVTGLSGTEHDSSYQVHTMLYHIPTSDDGAWTNLVYPKDIANSELASYLVRDTSPTGGPAPVPVPAPMLLLGSGLAGLAAARRRKNR